MDAQALAIANNDLVYLWWTYPEKIDECLGFAIWRHGPDGDRQPVTAFLGFDGARAMSDDDWQPTQRWPVQSYQWKDLRGAEEVDYSYEIVPVRGTPGEMLETMPELAVHTGVARATDAFGPHHVVFNRGIISTQKLARDMPKNTAGEPWQKFDETLRRFLREHIATLGDPIRERLAGEAPAQLTSLLERAQRDGGQCFCALYELTDEQLVKAIEDTKGRVTLILSNADSTENEKKVVDGTNRDTRERLHKSLGDDAIFDRFVPSNHIGHNKFVVYVDDSDTARAVVTGSTNWTATGLCSQSNNVLLLEDDAVAKRYREYWERLRVDTKAGSKQDKEPLRAEDAKPQEHDIALAGDGGAARIWFSPNTPQKAKPKPNPDADPPVPVPPDMAELKSAIAHAWQGVLFLLFNPGSPSILDDIKRVEEERAAAGDDFFVWGAISDPGVAAGFITSVFNDSAVADPRAVITGIAGIDDPFGAFEHELAQLGHAVIHDKVLVVDPFDDERCLVANGSHNLGYKASYSNDENLSLIRGNRKLAEAFATHVLDIVHHYNWRYHRQHPDHAGAGAHPFDGLAKDASWQDKYFEDGVRKPEQAARDRFFFGAT
jgi:phosphatidylserine/phosphatidylglycerophosphate/cardiolipin synthase-like enzyme